MTMLQPMSREQVAEAVGIVMLRRQVKLRLSEGQRDALIAGVVAKAEEMKTRPCSRRMQRGGS